MQQFQTQQAISRFNARVAQREAEQDALLLERDATRAELDAIQERQAREFDVATRRRIFRRVRGQRRALIGARGTEFTGSNLAVAADEAREMALDIAALEFASQAAEAELGDEAALARFSAEQVRESGRFSGRLGRFDRRLRARELPLRLAGSATVGAGPVVQGIQARSLTTRTSQAAPRRRSAPRASFVG